VAAGTVGNVGSRRCYLPSPEAPLRRQAAQLARRAANIRQRVQPLGSVEAPDERAAEAAAVAQFNLDEEQPRRLMVWEEDCPHKPITGDLRTAIDSTGLLLYQRVA
jgi:hypothetical protein